MATKRTQEDRNIREYLNQALPECRVKVQRDGTVLRYGSPGNPVDRGHDYWHYMGDRQMILRFIEEVRDGA